MHRSIHSAYSYCKIDSALGRWYIGSLLAVFSVETFYTTGRIDQLLLPCEEGMAARTNFNVQVACS